MPGGPMSESSDEPKPAVAPRPASPKPAKDGVAERVGEIGGPAGPEPTRFGDWEKGGRCSDF